MRVYLRAGRVLLRYAPPYRPPVSAPAFVGFHPHSGFSSWLADRPRFSRRGHLCDCAFGPPDEETGCSATRAQKSCCRCLGG
jgi:hypothetical protein